MKPNKLYSVKFLGFKMWVLNNAGASTTIAIRGDTKIDYPTPSFIVMIFRNKELYPTLYEIDYREVTEDEFRSEWLKRKLSKKIKDVFND